MFNLPRTLLEIGPLDSIYPPSLNAVFHVPKEGQAFVLEKFGKNQKDLIVGDIGQSGSVGGNALPQKLIPSKDALLLHPDDWRKSIPAYTETVFDDDFLPILMGDNYIVFKHTFYPLGQPVESLPPGEFYALS